MHTVNIEPKALVVWREPEAGVCGVRLFKDGEWIYEIIDDFLPCDHNGHPVCSRSVSEGEVQDWPAIVEKAYAKVHGSYEAIMGTSEVEALEDVLVAGTCRVLTKEFPIWGELWQHMRSKRSRGFAQIAVRRREALGQALTSGLISGYGYPVLRLELVGGEMLVELENPLQAGAWTGRWGEGSSELVIWQAMKRLEPSPGTCRPFWMSIQDFCNNFTDVCQARTVPSFWQCAAITCSSERPSYALISVTSPTQACFVVSQSDRRWSRQAEYKNSIGIRVYRARIVAPPVNATGVRQNVSSPFNNLELVAERTLSREHSAMLEVPRLEPNSLYVAAMDSEFRCPFALVRVLAASMPRFRELSAPEATYFLQAQANATQATDCDSFSSQGSFGNANNGSLSRQPTGNGWPDSQGACPGYSRRDQKDTDAINMPRMLKACIASCTNSLQC